MFPRGEKQSDLWAQVAFYTSLGFVIPVAVIVGYVLGWLLDQWLHTARLFALIIALLGAVGGLVEILQILTRAEKRADRNDADAGPKS